MALYIIHILIVSAAVFATIQAGFLSFSGGIATLSLAAVLLTGGGVGILPAALFFLPASLLSGLRIPPIPSDIPVSDLSDLSDLSDRRYPAGTDAKHAGRSAIQVLVNGAPGTVCYALWVLTTEPCWIIASLTSFAAASADTWSTEVGIRAGGTPRMILSGRPVPAGTSGAVSTIGFLASIVGSLVVVVGFYLVIWGLYAFDMIPTTAGNPWIFLSDQAPTAMAVFTGCAMLGGLVDSLAGATIQERFLDADTGQMVESMPVIASTKAGKVAGFVSYQRIKGISGINNDVVNLICTLVGAFLGHLVCSLI